MGNAKLKVVLTVILLVFAIVPALILGAVGTFATMGYESNVKMDTLKTVSLAKSASLDEIFSDYISSVRLMSKLDDVVATAKNGGDKADAILKGFKSQNEDVLDVLIVDGTGKIKAAAVAKAGDPIEHFEENTKLADVSTLQNWVRYNQDAFYFSKEIYANPDNQSGESLGYVCMVVSLAPESRIAKALQGDYMTESGKGAHLMLVDKDGNTLNFDGTGVTMKSEQVDSAFVGDVSKIFYATNNVSGGNSADNTKTDSVGKYKCAFGVIPNVTSWRWVGITGSDTIGSFALKTNIIGWVVILVVCALFSLLAILIANKFVGSMHDMLKTMEAISNGDSENAVRFKVKSEKSELGSIQASFNELLDEVTLSEERYRTIAELSDNMLFEWDFRKERMFVSENTLAKFEFNPRESTLSNGRFIDSLMPSEDQDKYKRDISSLLKNKNAYSGEYQLKAKSGAVIWVSLRASCITDRLGEPLRVIGVMTDIDNEKKMELQLSERASYDFLSQLYNRSTFIRTLTAEIERRGQNKVGLMFIDVDDFKFINDRYGHTIGDEVIRFVADTIRKKVDDRGGFAGRFGGDEFVLCYTNQEDIANLENIAMNIIDELYVGYTSGDGTLINVRASIGIAYCPEHSEDVNELLSFSDTAMYFVKKNGKTNYHVYMPEDSASGEYIDPEGYSVNS